MIGGGVGKLYPQAGVVISIIFGHIRGSQAVISWGSEFLSSCGSDSKGDEAIEVVCREMEKHEKMVPSKHWWRFQTFKLLMMQLREGKQCSLGLLQIPFSLLVLSLFRIS